MDESTARVPEFDDSRLPPTQPLDVAAVIRALRRAEGQGTADDPRR